MCICSCICICLSICAFLFAFVFVYVFHAWLCICIGVCICAWEWLTVVVWLTSSDKRRFRDSMSASRQLLVSKSHLSLFLLSCISHASAAVPVLRNDSTSPLPLSSSIHLQIPSAWIAWIFVGSDMVRTH